MSIETRIEKIKVVAQEILTARQLPEGAGICYVVQQKLGDFLVYTLINSLHCTGTEDITAQYAWLGAPGRFNEDRELMLELIITIPTEDLVEILGDIA